MNKFLIAICLVLSACASPTLAPVQQGNADKLPLSNAEQNSDTSNALTVQSIALTQSDIDAQALNGNAPPELHSVYFDFGAFQIRPEANKVIQQQVDFMKAHAGAKVMLEGNTDERGSNEFNLALADMRAIAVKKLMRVSGIDESRIRTSSFGEEKPRLTCHEERCWKENRRVDFFYKAN